MKLHPSFALVMLVAALAACGKSDKDAPAAADASARKNDALPGAAAAAEPKRQAVGAAALAQADPSTAEANYVPVNSGAQLAYLYYAVSGMPVDYDKLAGIVSQEFRTANNEFKKQEILQTLKPKIDQQIALFRQNRYVVIDTNYQLDHIDMASKSFPLRGLPSKDSYVYYQDSSAYKLALTNAEAFSKYKATSDAQARELEDLVEKYRARGNARLYLYAQDTDLNAQLVRFQAVRVKLLAEDGKPIAQM